MYQIEWRKVNGKGRGVFALKNFRKGEVIEECPVIPLTIKESRICNQTILEYYLYPWKTNRDRAVITGYGFLYNHSFEPNARYDYRLAQNQLVYRAIRTIKRGEEITVNYNGDPKDKRKTELFTYHGGKAKDKQKVRRYHAKG